MDTTPELPTYTIHQSLLGEVDKRVKKVNGRLARAGATERFTYTATPFTREETDPHSKLTTIVPLATVTISAPRIVADGWTFVATLVREAGGMIVRTVPGQSLADWERPEEHACDYCGKTRARSRSYVVRNAAGQFCQIGSNCLAPFLGVAPSGLWALDYDTEELIPADTAERSKTEFDYPLRSLLALAWVVSEDGRQFVTRGAAQQMEGVESTAAATLGIWHWRPGSKTTPDEHAQVDRLRRAADEVPAAVIDELLAAGQDLDRFTDYGQNMAVVMESGAVSQRSVGLAVSLIAVYNRKMQRIAERKAGPQITDEWLGEKGDKLSGIAVTLTTVMEVAGYRYDSTDTLIVMRAESGHVLKWTASGQHPDLQVGQQHTLVRATVKKLDTYRDVKQTVVTRCKLAPIHDAQEQAGNDENKARR